jgi:hypothetical protein
MFEEKRKSARHKVNEAGRAVFGGTEVGCMIDDISEGGVRLIVEAELPDEFFLKVASAPEALRKCRLVWRLDDEVGAEFA